MQLIMLDLLLKSHSGARVPRILLGSETSWMTDVSQTSYVLSTCFLIWLRPDHQQQTLLTQ